MKRVRASIAVPGRPEQAEALWLDRVRWPAWIDGFAHVVRIDDGWPQPGSQLRWRSVPRGRGLVDERVDAHVPGEWLALEVEDERLRGRQTVAFAAADDATRVALTLEYELKERTFPLVDRFFVRRSLQDSLRRTLARFANERRAELDPPAFG